MLNDDHLANADLTTLITLIVLPGNHPRAEQALQTRFTYNTVVAHRDTIADPVTKDRLSEFLAENPAHSMKWLSEPTPVREG